MIQSLIGRWLNIMSAFTIRGRIHGTI